MIGRHYPYLLRLLYLREPFLVDKVCVVEEQVYLQVRWTDRIETHKTKVSRHAAPLSPHSTTQCGSIMDYRLSQQSESLSWWAPKFLVCKCKCTTTVIRQDQHLLLGHPSSPHRLIAVVVPDLDGDLSLKDYPVTIAQAGIQFWRGAVRIR